MVVLLYLFWGFFVLDLFCFFVMLFGCVPMWFGVLRFVRLLFMYLVCWFAWLGFVLCYCVWRVSCWLPVDLVFV